MSDKINQSEEYDSLGELFRRKLENHRLPVDGADWDIIEKRLSRKKKTGIVPLRYAGAAAAAAAAVWLLMVGRPFDDKPEAVSDSGYTALNDAIMHGRETVSPDAVSENTGGKTNPRHQNAGPAVLPAHRKTAIPAASRQGTPESEVIADVPAGETASPLSESVAGDTTGGPLPGNDAAAALSELGADASVSPEEAPKLDISLVEDKPDEVPDEKEPGGRMLAAAFGTGGAGGNFLDMPAPDKNMQQDAVGPGYAAEVSNGIRPFDGMDVDDFSDIDYDVPLSFGLTAGKRFGKYLSAGTGLMYTYLSTRYKWADRAEYGVHQRLHYLGIPVHLTVYPWGGEPKWSAYFAGGFMVEKGLRLVYTQQESRGNYIHTTTVKTSVDGVQWSLNGAFGVVYRFEKGFGVYFEPRMSYFFDNGQPASIRTDRPFSIGVNMGVNYEF